MSEMIERVALAISGGDDPTSILEVHRYRACAAIAAMREPTETMLCGARDWSIAKLGKAVGNRDATGCWRSMIEGALK